jgi:hypothetical protein
MQFTLDSEVLSLLEYFLLVVVLFALPVGLPMLLWLRRGPRNARDVLSAMARVPAGLICRCADFITWLVSAASLIGLQLLGMLTAFLMVTFDSDESPWWLAAPALAAGILLLAWMRLAHGPRTARDVLRITDRRTQ